MYIYIFHSCFYFCHSLFFYNNCQDFRRSQFFMSSHNFYMCGQYRETLTDTVTGRCCHRSLMSSDSPTHTLIAFLWRGFLVLFFTYNFVCQATVFWRSDSGAHLICHILGILSKCTRCKILSLCQFLEVRRVWTNVLWLEIAELNSKTIGSRQNEINSAFIDLKAKWDQFDFNFKWKMIGMIGAI